MACLPSTLPPRSPGLNWLGSELLSQASGRKATAF